MKNNYILTGMTCDGCVNSVKTILLQHPEVEEAEVHLFPQTAVLTMQKHIPVAELQALLHKVGDYTIAEFVAEKQ